VNYLFQQVSLWNRKRDYNFLKETKIAQLHLTGRVSKVDINICFILP